MNCNLIKPSFRYDQYDDIIAYSPEPEDAPSETSDYKARDAFLQRDNCFSTSELLPQCYECEKDPMTNKYYCRFYEFRKIERDNGVCKVVGFLDPHIDPTLEDLDLWNVPEFNLENETTDYILGYIATQFCDMSKEEMKAGKQETEIAWKRSVLEVREACDVCETSVFNFHWTCVHCGTCVCLDCYHERKQNISRWKPKTKADKEERDSFFWLKCHERDDHNMMLTQITTGEALMLLNENLHKTCEQRNITQNCGCSLRTKNCLKMESKGILLELPSSDEKQSHAALRELIKRQRYKTKSIPVLRRCFVDQRHLCQSVKHTYVSQKKILKITEPSESPECYKIFQEQWERGFPVIVANVTSKMRKYIWSPEYFSSRFGNEKHVMINCQNGVAIKQVAMKFFWDGFTSMKRRLPRDCDEKVVLKLKDWPTSNDFSDEMKDHFNDLMNALPLAQYTRRDGKYNLARYLPAHFSRPDLGPKMYSAYSQLHPASQGSTNLHLDVSDAINVMVHVSKPNDAHLAPSQYSIEAMRIALEGAGADEQDRKQIATGTRFPGAIWHIWPAHQAEEIRKVLHVIAKERGKPIGVNDDPIHDQVRSFREIFFIKH